MATKKSTKGRKSRSGGGKPGAARKSRPAKKRPDPVKSMALGALVIVVLLVFFTVPLGGRTAFNHLIDAFSSDEPAQKPAPDAPAQPPPARNAPTGAAPVAPPARPIPAPARPTLDPAAPTAPPMEDVSDREQADLDELIEEKTK